MNKLVKKPSYQVKLERFKNGGYLEISSKNILRFKEGGVSSDSIRENYYATAIPIIWDELFKTYGISDKEAVKLILGSMSFESLHGTSDLATKNYNFGGIGGPGKWTKFDSFESGVRHQVNHIVDTFKGFENGYDPRKYIETLKKYGYFQGTVDDYYGNSGYGWYGTYDGKTLKRYFDKYYQPIKSKSKTRPFKQVYEPVDNTYVDPKDFHILNLQKVRQ